MPETLTRHPDDDADSHDLVPAADETGYVEHASAAVIDLLQAEHALIWREVEAKLSESPQPHARRGFNPHILTQARTALREADLIEEIKDTTRGGRGVTVLALKNRYRKERLFQNAAARKRLLHTRYLGWAETSRRSFVGEAGEKVSRLSLRAAATSLTAPYLFPKPEGGEIKELFGKPVAGGSLDDAAHLQVLVSHMPVPHTVLIEVKNLRKWLYPDAPEVYQLLDKSAKLQLAYPDAHFVPILVCRRAHYTTFNMAKDLGFTIFYFWKMQPIMPHSDVDEALLAEVVDELGYDLVRTDQPQDRLIGAFRETLPKTAASTAALWAKRTPLLAHHFEALRDDTRPRQQHRKAFNEFRAEAYSLLSHSPAW